MAKAFAFLILLLISPAAYAVTYTVGDDSGWDSGVDYTNWANGKTFAVGDTLLFNYGFTHSVDEVSQADYQSCNTRNRINTFTTRPASVPLTAPGPRYFICPTAGHCSQGMRLAVTVTQGSTPTPGGPPASPSPPGTPPTSPTTGSPPRQSSPPPPGSSAASSSLRNGLMAGSSLVVAALLGVMG